MKNLIFLFISFLIIIPFSSCNYQKKEALKSTFNQLKEDINNGNLQAVLGRLDQESHTYLSDLLQIASQPNYDKAQKLGRLKNCELVTLLNHEYHQTLGQQIPIDEKIDKENILYIMAYDGTGMLRLDAMKRIRFKEFGPISKDKAVIKVRLDTGDGKHFITSNYVFHKEADSWNLNLLSTFRFDENLLRQQQAKTFLDEIAFVKHYAQNEPEFIEFQYQIGR